ncbi:hypothetical protein SAMN05216357_12452 [Porphyromonadaceae bacterium KH3CP3RA]|nr:hypothetical protein SAMN05216357_12452 [Porphyromonadaceae bacterium KH3CP3RA]
MVFNQPPSHQVAIFICLIAIIDVRFHVVPVIRKQRCTDVNVVFIKYASQNICTRYYLYHLIPIFFVLIVCDTDSGYEKKDKLEQEILEKIAKALDIPVEAITEVDNDSSINIFSGTWNDNSVAQNYHPSFNPIDKVAELYERLLKSEQEKVAMLQEILRDKK